MTSLTSLIERIEAATEGSRELDGDICLAFGWTFQKMKGDSKPYYRRPGETAYYLRSPPPEYSTSCDAALSLLSEGIELDLKLRKDGSGYACAWTRHGNRSSNAATPCLALLAAILRARQTEA